MLKSNEGACPDEIRSGAVSRARIATTTPITHRRLIHQPVEFIWHQSENLAGCDAIILPGGFAYGDYLRTGAIARFSPVMKSVDRFARSGGLVLGICNGFQILLEAGLLPGAMMRNKGLRYLCRHVHVRVESTDTPFTCAAQPGPGA